MKNRLGTLFILTLFGLLSCLSSCGLLDDDDDDFVNVDTLLTSWSAAIPAWSPDGQWIAIARKNAEIWIPCGIYLVKWDGSELQRIFSLGDGINIVDICWAPDGDWLAFSAQQEIWKIKANGDSVNKLTNSGANFSCSWSRSDTLIAFQHSKDYDNGIWLMDTNGNNQRSFMRLAGHLDFAQGDILFNESSINNDSAKMSYLNIVNNTERILYKWKRGTPYTTYYDPEVSPDGSEVVMSIDDNIRVLTLDDSNLMTLTSNRGHFPDWSPDGAQIVYCEPSDNPHGGKIRIMNSDGSDNHIIVDWHQIKPDSLN